MPDDYDRREMHRLMAEAARQKRDQERVLRYRLAAWTVIGAVGLFALLIGAVRIAGCLVQ